MARRYNCYFNGLYEQRTQHENVSNFNWNPFCSGMRLCIWILQKLITYYLVNNWASAYSVVLNHFPWQRKSWRAQKGVLLLEDRERRDRRRDCFSQKATHCSFSPREGEKGTYSPKRVPTHPGTSYFTLSECLQNSSQGETAEWQLFLIHLAAS